MYTASSERHKNKTEISTLGRDGLAGGWGVEPAVQAPTSLQREYQPRPQSTLLARVVRGYASNHYRNVCAEIDTGVTEHHNGVTVAVRAGT